MNNKIGKIGSVINVITVFLFALFMIIGFNNKPLKIKKNGLVTKFIKSLPFKLTTSQQNAINEILNDLNSSNPMHNQTLDLHLLPARWILQL